MNKHPVTSKTVWGGLFAAVEAALLTWNATMDIVQAGIAFIGTFATIYGFRDAIQVPAPQKK